jgi:endonuclease YncB( thermonuclease family)
LLNSGTVTATTADRDRDPNGRLLRHLAVNGRYVGDSLVAAGLARRYGGAKKAWC